MVPTKLADCGNPSQETGLKFRRFFNLRRRSPQFGIIVQNQLRRNKPASPRAFGMFYGMADVTPDLLI